MGQTLTYPESAVDQSYIPPSPNAQGFQTYGNDPVALFEGVPAISIPIYTVKCGSISLPISLSYNYNGLLPLQDAGWVGLGWNLNAGGAISRTVEGGVDNSQNTGYNYGEYSLVDSITGGAQADSFLQKAYNPNHVYPHTSYDMAPDIFDAEFNGYSGKFFWYNHRAFQLSYNKDMGINLSSPTGIFTITTADGVQYTFSNTETTTSYNYGGADSVQQSYISAWVLNRIVSADTKDTITLNYTTYTWQQATIPYQTSYTLNTGPGGDIGYDPLSFKLNPSISTLILKSIVCRNSRVSFISDSAARTDLLGTYARLKEIDVIDSITGNTVKKNTFSYEYFGQRVSNPAMYERLALKRFNLINPQLSSDSLTYTFKYIHETDTAFPAKSTYAMDYFGYYNGQTANATFLPSPNTTYYNPAPPGGASFSSASRNPVATFCSYGALDTIVYPAGGYTAFAYQGNVCNGNGGVGPGICLQSTTTVSNNPTSPQTIQKNYTYVLDDGATSSGVLTIIPNFTGPAFVYVLNGTPTNYNIYKAPTNSNGVGGVSPKFFYQKVTETISSGGETHKTDHYFTSYSGLFLDVRETGRVDYINTINSNTFTPVTKTISTYNQTGSMDTFFVAASAYIDTEYASATHNPKNWYAYGGNYTDWYTYWVHPNYQQNTQYDKSGDSITMITYYFYDSISNNVSSTLTQNLSDGQSIIKRFKYPEDYSAAITGNMVSARVLNPPIETQTWLYKNATDSVLISGNIMQFDQNIYKPVNTYAIETTKPITSLNNETRSSGRFTTILSDSRYILKGQLQYDGNNNLSIANKASDINVSYIWDYRHTTPIGEVKNAAQSDIAYSSFESDGKGNWSFTGVSNADATSPTGNNCYNLGQTSGNITKSGLTSSNYYIISYWLKRGTPLTITGTVAGYPIQGKTINGWTYFEHKITGQSSVTISGSGTLYIDEVRLYPYTAQMTTYTYIPLIGMSSQCDADNRITYYQYDPFGRLKVVLDQDHNIVKTVQYHYIGETNE